MWLWSCSVLVRFFCGSIQPPPNYSGLLHIQHLPILVAHYKRPYFSIMCSSSGLSPSCLLDSTGLVPGLSGRSSHYIEHAVVKAGKDQKLGGQTIRVDTVWHVCLHSMAKPQVYLVGSLFHLQGLVEWQGQGGNSDFLRTW